MKIKRAFLLIILIFFFTTKYVQAEELDNTIKIQGDSLGVTDFIQESNKYKRENFSDIDLNELFSHAISGDVDNKKIYLDIFKIFGGEIKNELAIFASIIAIIIINSILNCITEGLQNKSVSQIAFYVQYILILTIVLTNFSNVIESIKQSVNNMNDFTNMLVPILMTLIASTGNIATVSMIEPIIIFMITLIGNFINNVAIPLVLVSTALGIISKISDKVQVGKLAKQLKSSTVWIIGIILTAFVTIVSIEGNLSKSVDAVTAKTAKAAVSNLVPIVGKILGDAVDSVIGCSNILKSSVGVVGAFVVISISITPIIKLLLLMGIYYLGSAVCEPIADSKIINLLEQMGDTFKVLLALMCSMSFLMIIGITLVIRISGT